MFKRKEYKEKQLRYSIRKVSFGAASVAISALYLLMGSAAVSASEVQAVNGDQTTVTNPAAKDNEDKSRIEKHETTTEETNSAVVTLDKTSLTKLIEEIDGKFTSGKYASKTEDSVNKLKTALEAAKTALSNAKTQAELTQAHANLIVATTKLQTKPEEKKEAPVVDTTNGKATVGKKATNTEKASDSNSIANAGSRDERNGKALDANNPFRTGTDAATTDTDPAANQTYTAPAENADLNELKSELLKLPDAVQNNTKIQDMNDLGDQTGVARGEVKEIQEFGGWKAINQPDGTPGKFAIARKTEAGVFPVETVNTVFTNIRNGQARYYDTYVGEQAFDRSKDYMLFLGKVRTRASESEQTFNGKPYQSTGLGGSDSYAIKSFNGIEKTFKAHSPETGSKVKVAFKTGFTGDLNGTKAKYLVEVVYRQNNSEVTAYTYTFAPQPSGTVKDDKGIVTPAKNGTGKAYIRSEFNNYTLNKAEVEAKMAEEANKPNGQAGTFTSSDIDLPVGVTDYTVRIKVTDTDRMGMGYQSPLRHYALPVTGLDFSVEQDTRKLAKNLLQRVYDKLKATEAQDIKGKTDETISAYKEQLKNVENLLTGDLKNTQEYKDIVTAVLAGQQALRTDKSKLTASNNNLLGLINEDPDPRIGKTPISKEPYNTAKDEAVKAQTEAQTILAQENPDPDVVAAAVSKLNEKLAELKAARAELVVAATEAQKTKLEESAAKLVKADTAGKTQESIDAYETTYNNLKTELDKAIEAAAAIKTAGDNASEHAALKAQEAVDAVQAKLDAAKATLVDKATEEQVAELRKAEAALTPEEESSLAGTKTPASIAEYKKAVEAIQADLTQAKTTASDLVTKAGQNNAKKLDAAEAIAKVDALKAKLANATALLKDKANTGDLATAKEELKALAGVENVTDGKTTSTKDAYDAAKRDADAAVTAAEDVINNADSTPEQVAEALTNVKAKKAELEKAKAALVDKATDAQKTKLEESAAKLVKADTAGKTQESIDAYETTYNNLKTELDKAIEAAAAIKTAGDNASEHAALKAQEAVDAVQAKLDAAKATLVDKATEEQVAELRKAEAALTPAEESTLAGTKTPASIAEYKKAVEAIQADLTQAKTTASDLVTKAGQDNATKAEAAEAIAKVDALKAKLANATALLKDKANTSDLATAKEELKALAGVENVTDGKTTSTATAYALAKQAADAAVTAAEGIINNADSTPEQVAEALTNVKAKKAELEKAKAALVDKATDAQKTKLEESAAKLVKADTAGKTQESINEYETTYNNLKTELDKAIEAAAAIKTAGDNASRLEALAAQEAVDAVQAKLDAAKATLVDKATEEQVAELRKAESALTPAEESTLAGTKTPASIAEYKKAVEAIQADLTQAKTTASDLVTKAGQNNAKKADAAEAIAKVDALKAKLADATALLKDKANTSDLATDKEELKALAGVENVTDGKTTSTATAYALAKQAADAAVTAAEGIINNADSTPEQVAEALTNVKAKKAELEKAKAALVDKATDAQKTKLEESAAKLVKADTAGKTQESINEYETTYNNLKTELDKAIEAAAAIKTAGDNASRLEALAAQEAVDAVQAKLDAAKATLVDKATEEQVAELRKAEAALTPEEESSLAGTKTPASIAEYKKAVEAIQADLTQAKTTASDLVTKAGQDNATKAEAAEAIAKVDALKAKLANATALLKDKANTSDLATAKEELKALAGVENVTDGKTTSTATAYALAKQAADAAVTAAEGIINNADSTPEQVAEALTNVKAKKAELEKAKAALVDKATDAQKTKLEESAAKLVKADTAGKTQESINEYETTYNNLKTELDKAIEAAAAIKTAGDNASRLEALAAQEAVDAVQAKLDAAKATLVDKATEEQVAELRKAESALTPAEESTLAGTKTPASIAEYKKAVEAIQADLTQAKTTASDLVTKAGQNNAKKADAAEAIAKVDALKAKLADATALLKDKANTSDLATDKEELKALAGVENVTDGKTTSTATAYALAKQAADAAVTAAEGIINNADSTPEQVAEALTNVKAKKAELEKAKAALVDKATDAQKTKLEESAAKLVKADTAGKTQESINEYETTYNNLKTELDKAIEAAAAIKTAGDNASRLEALAAQEAVDAVQAKLDAAKATLVDKATEEQVAELRKAEAALTPEEESSLAGTKTPASIAEYKKAVEAIQADLTQAKTTASDLVTKAGQNNAKKVDAAEAIAKVDALKAKLADATALLKDKANTSDLATAKEELKALAGVENVTDGKTTSTKDAYDAAKRDADAAVTAAEDVINNADSTPEQVAEALTNVKAKKAELEKAKAALVDKATDAQKTKLEESAAKLVKADTAGKTQESIDAYETTYNNLKTELDKAIEAAAAIKTAGDNASEHAALKAQEAVDAVQAKLDAAKATLVDKATEEQVAELRKAESALTPAEESTLAGTKTPASIAEYKKAVEAIQADLTQAKTTASDLVTKAGQDNATKAEAAEAIAKVDALKAKLANATALLKDKANTSDLATAKEELKALAGVENVTDGKTTSTKDAYDAAKRDADAAVTAAEGIINNADSTPEQVAEALTNVKAKKAELEKAKAALVDKITQDQKDDLANAEENLKLADTTGKNEDSIKAYNDEVAKLSDELEAAKKAAKDLVDKGDNAGELEAYRVQAKINKLKSKLAEAAKLLKEIDKSAAKKEVEDAAKKATDAIVANNDLTSEQKEAAKAKVAEEATKAIAAIEKATTEDDVTTAKESGKLGIEKEAAKAEIEAAKAAKEKAIEANSDLTPEQKEAAKAKVAEEATKAAAAIDQATSKDAVTTATDAGKLGIEKEAAKAEIEAAKAAKEKAIEANPNLTPEQKAAAKAKVAEEATKATAAIDQATTKDGVTTATDAGKLGIEKEAAKAEIEAAKAAKEKAIEANTDLTPEQKAAAKAKVAEEATKATAAIDQATTKDGVTTATDAGKLGIEKEAAKAEIEAAKAAKEKAIEANTDLTSEQKAASKAKVAEEATKATAAIDQATTKDGVTTATDAGKLGIEKEAAKAEIEAAKAAKEKAIEANTDLTPEQKAAAKAKVAEEATKATAAIDQATTKDGVTTATDAGKLGIEKEAAKAEIEAAKAAKEKAIEANTDLTPEQKAAAKAKVAEEATKATAAIDQATTKDGVTTATDAGKLGIEKEAAKAEIEAAKAAKEKAIEANPDLTPEQKAAAKAKVAEEATKATAAIDQATTKDGVTTATDAGKLGIEKEAAKAEIEAAKAAKEKAIDANDKLSDSEKQAAKEEAARVADEAKKAIDVATDSAGVDGAKTTGTTAVEAINPVGKEKALDAIQKATEDKLSEIDRDDKLSDKEKDKAKAEVAKAAIEAVNAINAATDQASVDAKQTEGTKAVSEVNPVGKDKAKAEIEKSLSEKTNAIDANSDLTDEQKAEAKAKIADEAKKAIDAIDKATTTEDVAAAKESGKLAIEKEAAKAEIEAAKAAKEKAIDANPDLTDDEKATAKERVEEEAEAAKNAIDKATELSDIDKVTETGKDDIKKVTVTSAKEEAKKAIDKALEEKEKAIDARTDLTEEEKEAAKKAAREEAEAAKNAIDKATTLEDINKVLEDGKENIAKINPENLKDKAKKAIDEALAAKEKAIDARTDLTEEEKEAAKKAAREEAEAAKNAIDKATTSEDINKVLEDGKENIAKINPENLKDKAKKAIDEALAAKEKAIDARTDLTQEEKEVAKKAAREEAEAAKNAIDKATTSEDINKVLEDGKENIAKINPVGAKEGALAFEGSLQASVTGVVKVELGKAITQADIIAKLNLPESITVISIDLPDTTTLGRKFAKVTLRLADGKETTVFVPVEVVESSKEDKQQNNTQEDSKPTVVPSNNSEQPTVTQTKDVKENPSNTSQESKGSNQKVLPNTGTGNEVSIFGSAAMTVLASLGLVATSKKKEEE